MNDELINFIEDEEEQEIVCANPWVILVVDDDKEIHHSTEFALSKRLINGRPIKFIHAYTGFAARNIIEQNPNVHLMLLDAVMETETAGLDCAKYIKFELNRKIPIIVMRSGFAGWEIEYNKHNNPALDDFIMKSATTSDVLIGVLEKWLKDETICERCEKKSCEQATGQPGGKRIKIV